MHTCYKHINKHVGSFDIHREDHNKAARELSAEKQTEQILKHSFKHKSIQIRQQKRPVTSKKEFLSFVKNIGIKKLGWRESN